MSRDNPLEKEELRFDDLKPLTEITHGDSYISPPPGRCRNRRLR